MPFVIMLGIKLFYCYAEYRYAEYSGNHFTILFRIVGTNCTYVYEACCLYIMCLYAECRDAR